MTARVRFLRADFAYGCHIEGTCEIPEKDAPVVIAGPNGSGKTTLVEALVRTLFGFDRRQPADRDRLASRTPWGGRGCRAAIEIAGGDGRRWRVRRDFDAGRVELEPLDGGEPWSGDGNPAAGNQEALEYRRRLAAIFGLSEIELYESTACIAQGRLLDTRLREDLLQIEGGGYGNVDEALSRITDDHRRLTNRTIDGSGQSRRRSGALEALDLAIESLVSRIRSADRVLAWRAPLEQEVDRLRARLEEIDAGIARLEAALGPLNGRRALESRIDASRVRRAAIEKARHRLERALRQLDAIEDAVAVPLEERYPTDFLERVGRLEWMWNRQSGLRAERDRLEAEPREADVPRPWIAPAAAAALLALGTAAALVRGSSVPALVGVALALVAGGALAFHRGARLRRIEEGLHRKRVVYEELDRLGEDLARELEGVPRARTVSPATIEERRRAFEAQRQAVEKVGAARAAVDEELRDARRTLSADGFSVSGAALPIRGGAEEALSRCAEAAERARTEIARAEIEIDGLAGIDLPRGVAATPEAVDAALAELRTERRRVEAEARAADSRLLQEGTGQESPVALRDELQRLEAERAGVEREARVHEAAHALVRDAYAEFREHDRDRLLAAVSGAMLELTSGAIGPVEAPESLAEARVVLRGRSVDLRSPPLSYGEFHAALLGIRLGASDFHARSGIRPPMIVDEPFAYLDLDRARDLWRLLCGAARERQVFVLTQEVLTLGALGIAPDITLAAPLSAPAARGGEAPG